jgi:transcriptional regulator with XRE-family HTH domain
MINETIVITKELGSLLASARIKARLTQKEVGERLGFSGRSGRVYVSRLEKGGINNPSLWLILKFLNICEKPWASFFEKLAGIYFTKQHDRIMAQVPTTRYHRKIDRDVAKYTHSIKTKFSEKQKIKPLTQQKKDKMSLGFAKHRANIEPIEREIQKLLGELSAPLWSNQFYKAFARECYTILKKNKPLNTLISQKELSASSVLNIKLNQIIEKWAKKGLKREFLNKVKDIVLKYLPQSHKDTENKFESLDIS